jgi:hypothetical protein
VQVVMGPKRSRVSVSKKPRDILTPEMADRRGGPPSLDTKISLNIVVQLSKSLKEMQTLQMILIRLS